MYKQIGTDFNCGFGKLAVLTVFQSSFFWFVEIDMMCWRHEKCEKGRKRKRLPLKKIGKP